MTDSTDGSFGCTFRLAATFRHTSSGFARLNDLLGLIKEVGGLRKMKELLEAMSLPETDAIPF